MQVLLSIFTLNWNYPLIHLHCSRLYAVVTHVNYIVIYLKHQHFLLIFIYNKIPLQVFVFEKKENFNIKYFGRNVVISARIRTPFFLREEFSQDTIATMYHIVNQLSALLCILNIFLAASGLITSIQNVYKNKLIYRCKIQSKWTQWINKILSE